MIKLAQLANKLDEQGLFQQADKIDQIMSQMISFNKKIAKIHPNNIRTYQENHPEFIKLSQNLYKTLKEIDNEASRDILSDIKIAGLGDWLSGLGEIAKTPFSAVGRFFRDLSQGGKLKRSLDKSMKNLSNIRELIESGEEASIKQAQSMILEGVDSILGILKDAYGDLVFFDSRIENHEPKNDSTSTPSDEPASLNEKDEELLNILTDKAASTNNLIKKYSQNAGALALINDLAQLRYAVQNTNDLKTAFNAWVTVLTALNNVQYDRRPEPKYRSRNPDINHPSRGGGWNPYAGTKPHKEVVDVESLAGPEKIEILKSLGNKMTFSKAVKDFKRFFPEHERFTHEEVEHIVESIRRRWNPKKIWKDSPFEFEPEKDYRDTLSGWR